MSLCKKKLLPSWHFFLHFYFFSSVFKLHSNLQTKLNCCWLEEELILFSQGRKNKKQIVWPCMSELSWLSCGCRKVFRNCLEGVWRVSVAGCLDVSEGQVRSGEVKVRSSQFRSSWEVKSGQVKSRQVRFSRDKLSWSSSSQGRSNQDRASQIGSSQIKSKFF